MIPKPSNTSIILIFCEQVNNRYDNDYYCCLIVIPLPSSISVVNAIDRPILRQGKNPKQVLYLKKQVPFLDEVERGNRQRYFHVYIPFLFYRT